jgi:hypothetical protein
MSCRTGCAGAGAGLPPSVTALRVFDVIAWMEDWTKNKARNARIPADHKPCANIRRSERSGRAHR